MESARAEAERVRLTGAAEARAIEAVGRAEAERMRMKASAYKQYGDAAVMALVLEALPQVRTHLFIQYLFIVCTILYWWERLINYLVRVSRGFCCDSDF